MELSARLVQSEDAITREVGGDVVLLDLATGTYFGLNPVGTRIWNFLGEQARSLSEIRDMLVMEFEVNEEDAERDSSALVNDLLEHGLLLRETH